MSELVIASNEADAHAAEAVKQHHAALAGALNRHTEALFTTASGRDPAAAEQARRDLVDWCERELSTRTPWPRSRRCTRPRRQPSKGGCS